MCHICGDGCSICEDCSCSHPYHTDECSALKCNGCWDCQKCPNCQRSLPTAGALDCPHHFKLSSESDDEFWQQRRKDRKARKRRRKEKKKAKKQRKRAKVNGRSLDLPLLLQGESSDCSLSPHASTSIAIKIASVEVVDSSEEYAGAANDGGSLAPCFGQE